MFDTLDEIYSINDDLAVQGVRKEVGYNKKGDKVVMIIAATGTPKHNAAQRKRSDLLEQTRFNEAQHEKVIAEIIAESILLDWSGVIDEKGKPIPATFENKLEAILKYKRLMGMIMTTATDMSQFRSNVQDASEKN